MRTIKSFDDALDFYPREPRAAFQRFFIGVWTCWSAMRDGLAAARAYHELTTHGASHEAAVQKVFNEHFGAR